MKSDGDNQRRSNTFFSPNARANLGGILASAAFVLAAASLQTMAAEGDDGLERVYRLIGDAKTIRIRGWEVKADNRSNMLGARVQFEILIKRPAMYRYTINGSPPPRGANAVLCDGTSERVVTDSGVVLDSKSLNPLDASFRTENLVQHLAVQRIMGPTTATFQINGQEQISGRTCKVYEGRSQSLGYKTVHKIWIDAMTGLPLQSSRQRQVKGSLVDEMQTTDVSLDVPLADDLFHAAIEKTVGHVGPKQSQSSSNGPAAKRESDLRAAQAGVPLLDATPTGTVNLGKEGVFAVWRAVRIANNAAIVVWRRTTPAVNADGHYNWLSDIQVVGASCVAGASL